MKKLGHVAAAILIAGGIAFAQEKTKVSVEEGKTITVTGCVERAPDGTSLMLTNVTGKSGPIGSYMLVTDDSDDLVKHIGHRVEISGKAADKGKGKIKVETKSKDDNDNKTETKSEVKGDLKGLPFLGVKSVRMLASVCP